MFKEGGFYKGGRSVGGSGGVVAGVCRAGGWR